MRNKRFTLHKITVVCSLVCLLGAFAMTGCTAPVSTVQTSQETVFTFAGNPISFGEVALYAYTVRDDYERLYGGDIWDTQIDVDQETADTLENATREDIIEDIIRVKLLNLKAPDYDTELTSDDRTEALEASEKFWENMTDEQIEEYGLTQDIVLNVITENKLAKKVYDKLISEAGIEISAEEARRTTFYDMYFECFSEDAAGNIKEFSEEEKKAQYDRAVQAYNTLISTADTGKVGDVETLADFYGLSYASSYTMSPSEIQRTYGEEIRNQLYSLEDGSFSLVTETEYGYHIFYMRALTDAIATNNRRDRLKRSREAEYFKGIYDNWIKATDPNFSYDDSVNMDLYNRIEF